MKRFSIGVVTAMGLIGATTGAAVASPSGSTSTKSPAAVHGPSVKVKGDIKIVASGETANEGWVAFTGTGEVTVNGSSTDSMTTALTSVSAGGGEWVYGGYYSQSGAKVCISNYQHNIANHGSTAKMGGVSDHNDVQAPEWSYAMVVKVTTSTCYAYWRKN